LVSIGTELFLFTAAHKTSELSNLNFNQAGYFVANKSSLFLHKLKRHLVGPASSGIAGYSAQGAKIILRTHQITAELRRENRRKSAKKAKTKHLLQSIFVNKVVTVGWTREEKSSTT